MRVSADASQLLSLATFASAAAKEAGFDRKQTWRIELAVDEACSNIIEHAYAGQKGGWITLKIAIEPNEWMQIVLEDQGKGFDPTKIAPVAPTTSLDHVRIGGMGVHMMRTIMDEVKFEFKIPYVGNRLTMIKKVWSYVFEFDN